PRRSLIAVVSYRSWRRRAVDDVLKNYVCEGAHEARVGVRRSGSGERDPELPCAGSSLDVEVVEDLEMVGDETRPAPRGRLGRARAPGFARRSATPPTSAPTPHAPPPQRRSLVVASGRDPIRQGFVWGGCGR